MPRLTQGMYNTYLEYKLNTALFVRWMTTVSSELLDNNNGSTAQQESIVPPETAPVSSKRRAKVKGKRFPPKQASASVTASPQKSVLSVNELVDIATKITQTHIQIPRPLLILLDQVIRARERFARFFTGLTRGPQLPQSKREVMEEKTKSHGFFLDRLKDMFEMFSKEKWSDKWSSEMLSVAGRQHEPKNKPTDKGTDEAVELKNYFELLSVDESGSDNEEEQSSTKAFDQSEWLPEGYSNKPKKAKTKPPPKKVTAKLQDYGLEDDLEQQFAIYSFFSDAQQTMAYVAGTWESVSEGTTTTMEAAAVTTMAISLVKSMEAELRDRHPTLRTYDDLLEKLVIFKPTDFRNEDQVMELMELALLDVYGHLRTFSKVPGFNLALKQAPVLKPGYFGEYDPHAEVDPMNPYRDEIILAGSHMAEWAGFYRLRNAHVPYARDLLDVFHTYFLDPKKNIDFSVVFALKAFFVSIDETRFVLNDQYEILQTHLEMCIATVNHLLRDTTDYHMRQENEHLLMGLLSRLQCTMKVDPLYDLKIRTLERGGESGHVEEFLFLKQNPWMNGIYQYRTFCEVQFYGLLGLNVSGVFAAVAHLYNLLCAVGKLEPIPIWEKILTAIGDGVFSGKRPTKNFYKAFNIMLGARPETFAVRGRRLKKGGKPDVRSNPCGRGIHVKASLFMQVFHGENGDISLTKDLCERLIQMSVAEPGSSRVDHLLAGTGNCIRTEMMGCLIGLDYCRIQLFCTHLLRIVNIAIQVPKGYVGSDIQLPNVAGYITMVTDGLETHPEISREEVLHRASVGFQSMMESFVKEDRFFFLDAVACSVVPVTL